MTPPPVVFQRLAAGEFRKARNWYAARSPEVADRFRLAVSAAVERLSSGFESLPILVGDYRRIRTGRFPYLLIARRKSNGVILVVAVAHAHRRPGYWKRRDA
jgi:toxin ParE2